MSLVLYSFEYILYDTPSFTRGYDKYFPRYNQNYPLPLRLIPLVTYPSLGPHVTLAIPVSTPLYHNGSLSKHMQPC